MLFHRSLNSHLLVQSVWKSLRESANHIHSQGPKMASVPTLPATSNHTATLIFLHGLGDTGHGWLHEMGEIRPPFMKVICPTAPTQPVTLNGGFRMPSWFDLRTLDMHGPEDEEGIKRAAGDVHALIQSEISAGIPSNRIYLGGFSQGGALALYAGLTFVNPLAGLLALSCWLPLHKSFPAAKKSPDTVPILQCHGDSDQVVSHRLGQQSHENMKQFMTNAKFLTYRGLEHSATAEELSDMQDFIQKNIK